jgi:hypothetical protein
MKIQPEQTLKNRVACTISAPKQMNLQQATIMPTAQPM